MEWQYNWTAYSWTLGLLIALFYACYVYRAWRARRVLGMRFSYAVLGKALWRMGWMILLLVALWGPLYGYQAESVRLEGRDIYFCVDLSASMDATDVSPTRLERVKWALRRQVAALEGSRMGVIIFSSEAFIQCPLTYDVHALYLFIDALHTGLVPSSGTYLQAPIALALRKLALSKDAAMPLDAEGRIRAVVLFSDGEDFGGGLTSAGRALSRQNVHFYAVGIGTETGSRIPIGSGRVKRDRSGQVVITRYEEDALRTLLQHANGEYYRVSNERNELDALTESLRALRGRAHSVRKVDVSANRYLYFLLPALLMMGLDFLVRPKTFRL